MTIQGKIYKTSKGRQIYLSGSVDDIKIDHKIDLVIQVSKDGRTLTMRPLEDMKIL